MLELLANIFSSSGGPWWANLLLPMGMVLILLSLMMTARKRRQRHTQQHLTPHERIERTRQQRAVRDDLGELMVEIEQLAKRLGAQLDAKSIAMEQLLAKADQRIAELRRLQGEPPPPEASPPQASPPQAMPSSAQGAAADPAGQSDDPAGAADPLARSVYELSDEGLGPVDIARRLDEHVGKVELILALRQA